MNEQDKQGRALGRVRQLQRAVAAITTELNVLATELSAKPPTPEEAEQQRRRDEAQARYNRAWHALYDSEPGGVMAIRSHVGAAERQERMQKAQAEFAAAKAALDAIT